MRKFIEFFFTKRITIGSVRKYSLLVLIPLALSAFVHLWNPFGFPSVHNDEAHYMRRAMQVLEGLGPQESYATYASPYDHPYFGQVFLASALSIVSYPDSLAPFGTSLADIVQSIERIYSIPRVLMGLLAIADTFLVYKISERRYDKRIAFVAAILFAVMPIGWLNKRIVLDSIMLPFILISIYFALSRIYGNANLSTTTGKLICNYDPSRRIVIVLLSGIFLGLAIFTKIPAFTFVPLVGFIIFSNSNRSFRMLGVWFIPVILIPMLWPLYSVLNGDFETWWEGVVWQTGREGRGMLRSIIPILESDPVLLLLGFIGIVYATSRKDLFPIIWLAPFILFHYLIPFIQHFHWVPLVPLLCISGAYLIVRLLDYVGQRVFSKNNQNEDRVRPALLHMKYYFTHSSQYAPLAIIVSIFAVFGFSSSMVLINSDVNSTLFEVNGHIVKLLLQVKDTNLTNPDAKPLVMGSGWTQVFTWIPEYIYDISHNFRTFTTKNMELAPQSSQVILLIDSRDNERYAVMEDLSAKDLELFEFYNDTRAVYETNDESDVNRNDVEQYPYGSLRENHAIRNGDWIEIRTKENRDSSG